MNNPEFELENLSGDQKRELLLRLLRERAAAADKPFPLSPGQEALWFLHEMAPESAAYNVAFCVRLESAVDCKRLEGALQMLLQRHPMLRCTFRQDAQGPAQQLAGKEQPCLEHIDASLWDEEELQLRVKEFYRRPFDLSVGPVFRVTLFTGSKEGDVLLLSAHHIVFDAWSLGILLYELGVLYDTGSADSLPVGSASYTEFVDRQRALLETAKGRDAFEYWRARLKDVLAPVDLPADQPRPSALSFCGATHHFEIPGRLVSSLRKLAQAENATPFTILAAGFHTLLHRYTGASEIPIGTPLSGRSDPQFEGTVGYFVNPVIISAPVLEGCTFREHVAAMREAAIAAQEHGDLPFIELVKRLRPDRDASRTPLFQVMLNLIKATQVGVAGEVLHAGAQDLRIGSLRVRDFPLEQQEGQFDLDLTVLDAGDAMPATLKYRTDLFEPETIARMADHFLTLLSAATAEPDTRLSELPLLTQQEQQTIMVDWNATDRSYPDTTIPELFAWQVERSPNATALVFEQQTISYQQLNARANQLARYLRKNGVGRDTLVAVCLERSFEMVVALLGILKAGGAYVPVDPGYPMERQEYMIRDAGASVILSQANIATRLSNSGTQVLALDKDWHLVADQSTEELEDFPDPGSLAYVIYTSGSTGEPKGAMNTHRGVCNRLLWMQDEYKLGTADCVLQKTPFSFDVSVWEFFWPLITGARLVLARPEGHKDPAYIVDVIRETGVTTLHFVPSMLRIFLEAENLSSCTSLKRVICSGEALPYELQERFFELLDAELHNLYGPTEAAVDVTYWACERGSARKLVPIGRPVANTQVYVLDSNRKPVPVGIPGELYLGGVQVGRGYWRRQALTDERFVADTFRQGGRLYRTGDLVRWLPDGVIDYLGRTDHQVKLRGFRIELGEIEAVLSQDSRIKQVVVIVREDVRGDQRLVAYLSVRGEERPAIADLRATLAQKIPEYMVPSEYVFLDELPLTPNGKVDRRALPKPDYTRAASVRPAAPPKTEVEVTVAGIWKEVLRVPAIGIYDNFFEVGGHSLSATGVLSRVRDRFGISLPLRTIFDAPTIHLLASRIETMLWATRSTETSASEEREEIEL